ncbi:hypothetical protein ABPG73_001207 [Tetrahymena malaccensis]
MENNQIDQKQEQKTQFVGDFNSSNQKEIDENISINQQSLNMSTFKTKYLLDKLQAQNSLKQNLFLNNFVKQQADIQQAQEDSFQKNEFESRKIEQNDNTEEYIPQQNNLLIQSQEKINHLSLNETTTQKITNQNQDNEEQIHHKFNYQEKKYSINNQQDQNQLSSISFQDFTKGILFTENNNTVTPKVVQSNKQSGQNQYDLAKRLTQIPQDETLDLSSSNIQAPKLFNIQNQQKITIEKTQSFQSKDSPKIKESVSENYWLQNQVQNQTQKYEGLNNKTFFKQIYDNIFKHRFCKKRDLLSQGLDRFSIKFIERQVKKDLDILQLFKDVLFLKKAVMIILDKDQLAAISLIGCSKNFLGIQENNIDRYIEKLTKDKQLSHFEEQFAISLSEKFKQQNIELFLQRCFSQKENQNEIDQRILSSIY